MSQPEKTPSAIRRFFGSPLVGAALGAIIGGAQANHAQAQLQVETTSRTVYAEFLGASTNWCTVLQERPVDQAKSNAALATSAKRPARWSWWRPKT